MILISLITTKGLLMSSKKMLKLEFKMTDLEMMMYFFQSQDKAGEIGNIYISRSIHLKNSLKKF
jgi:hypothetical protein